MSESNGQQPLGYGQDRKGAAGGENKNQGRVHVAPPLPPARAPMPASP